MFGSLKSTVTRWMDRTNPQSRASQDLAVNVSVFALAVWAISRYGHKLAV